MEGSNFWENVRPVLARKKDVKGEEEEEEEAEDIIVILFFNRSL